MADLPTLQPETKFISFGIMSADQLLLNTAFLVKTCLLCVTTN